MKKPKLLMATQVESAWAGVCTQVCVGSKAILLSFTFWPLTGPLHHAVHYLQGEEHGCPRPGPSSLLWLWESLLPGLWYSPSTWLTEEDMVSWLDTHRVTSRTCVGQSSSFVHFSRVMTCTGKVIDMKMKGQIYFLDSKPSNPVTCCNGGNVIFLALSLTADCN